MTKQKYRKTENNGSILEAILIGIFKLLWLLVKLPFSRNKRKGLTSDEKGEVLQRRLKIEQMIQSDNRYEVSQALMEADKLVDYILKLMGYKGETFADRLRSAQGMIEASIYDGIWQGHKIRNILAHEHGNLSLDELKSAINKLLRYVRDVK